MKWVKRIFILALVLVVIAFGGLALYQEAYSVGETAGYNVGYDSGYSIGQEDGHSLGKTEGYSLGKQDGYSLGKQEGYISGKAEGYDEGILAGLGHGYTLKDPTYKQAVKFLREDKTDRNKYVEDSYVCSHFARDVCNNAEVQGFRCAFVELRYSGGGHSIIAFDTIDRGLLYFEPQSDEVVKPIIGKEFWRCIEPKPGYRYEKPSYDDTIMEVLVIW